MGFYKYVPEEMVKRVDLHDNMQERSLNVVTLFGGQSELIVWINANVLRENQKRRFKNHNESLTKGHTTARRFVSHNKTCI